MRTQNWKRHITGLLAALLAVSMPVQALGAALPGSRAHLRSQEPAGPSSAVSGMNHAEALLQESESFDPVFYGDTYPDVTANYGNSAAALEAHYRTFGYYEGRMANAGDLLAWRLRAARLVRRFLDYNRDLYLNGAVDASFPWFNADAYLSAYPEIREQLLEQLRKESASSGNNAADPGAAQLRAVAVHHYLDQGALEGRGSCTAFDPVWAIVALPDIAVPRHGALRPEELAAAFSAATGKNDTSWFAVGTPDRILQVLNTAAEGTGSAGSPAAHSEDSTGSSDSDDSVNGRGDGESLNAYTYLLYLCGSDLETDTGEGSQAIYDAMYGLYRLPESSRNSMQVVICAGGAREWASDYMNSYLTGQKKRTAVYTINADAVVKRMDALKAGTADMSLSPKEQQELFTKLSSNGLNFFQDTTGSTRSQKKTLCDYLFNAETLPLNKTQLSTGTESISETPVLKSFLSVAKQSAPAKDYGICFWDHGGGLNGGVCQDEFTGKSLYVDEIRSAFKESDLHFSLLGFDCCLMGSTEIAYYLNEYYDYMIASEENTRGSFAYDEMLQLLAAGAQNPDRAAREAALKALAVRHQSWRGGATDFEGGAVIDGKKSEAAATALNGLAGRMLTFMNTGSETAKSDHRGLVYDTLWSVRVRCYNFGTAVNGSKTDMTDLVDTGDFLTQLRNELKLRESNYKNPDAATKAFFKDLLGEDKKSGLIGSALTAADALTIASFGVVNQNYMYSSGIPGVTAEKTWEGLRSATELTGSSIYFPYFSPDGLEKYRNPKQNPWDSGKSLLFGDGSSFAKLMKGFTEYIGLTEKGSTESEKNRIEYLKLELTEGKRLKTDDKGVPEKNKNGDYIYTDEKVPGYEELLKIRWTETTGTDKKKKEDHLEIAVDSNVYTDQNWSQWSRGDAFADLMDTAETMTVFITRAVEAKLRERSDDSSGGEKADNKPVMIDLVIGQHKIRYNSTDGGADKLRVFANAIDSSISNMVEGSVAHYYNNNNEFEGWHTWQELVVPYADVEDYNDKKRAIESVLGPDKDRNLKEYTIFRGGVTMKDQNARVPQDVCLIFGKNKDGDTVYLGAAERTSVKNAKADEAAYTYSRIDGIDEIRFDHLMIYDGADTNRKAIAYAESYYDLVSPTYYSVSFPDTAPVCLKNPNDEENKPGEASQNKYYVALMPEYGLGDAWSVFILDQTVYDTNAEAAAKGEVAEEKPQTKEEEKTEAEERPAAAAAASGVRSAEKEDADGSYSAEAVPTSAAEPAAESSGAETADTTETADTSDAADTSEAADNDGTGETADNEVADSTPEAGDADETAGQTEDDTAGQTQDETAGQTQDDTAGQTQDDTEAESSAGETADSQTDSIDSETADSQTESTQAGSTDTETESSAGETADSQADSIDSEAGSQADSSDSEAGSGTLPDEKEAA